MDISALSNQLFVKLLNGKHFSQNFRLPHNDGTFYVSTHPRMDDSDRLHYHEEPHLTLILNGGVVDKRKNMDDARLPGDLMFFHSGEPHQTINKTFPTTYITLLFQPEFLKKKELADTKLNTIIEKNPNSKFVLIKIYSEFLAKDEFSGVSVEMLMHNLIETRIEYENIRPTWLDKVFELLNDSWNDDLSLADLSIAAGVHPKTISKYFPKYFACTLGEYRRKLKVERSLLLIKTSNHSLTDIAYECGFYDQSHFIRTFKQLNGFSPKAFQKL